MASETLQRLQRQLPAAHWIGGSTAGELAGGRLTDNSVVLALVGFEHTRLISADLSLKDLPDPHMAGTSLGKDLERKSEGEALRSVLVVGAGSALDGQALLDGLQQSLPGGVVITGGLAGDGTHFERPWALTDDGPREDQVRVVGLVGSRLRVATSCARGWIPFGPTRRITRCVGNTLFELDGQSALELYQRYLGELAEELPGSALRFPLEVRGTATSSEPLVRTVLSINRDAGSMTFAGTLPHAGQARLMRASRSDLIESAARAASELFATWPVEVPAFTTVVSCVGRRLVLGTAVEEELLALQAAAPAGSSQLGFCSYGEMAPVAPTLPSLLHNQSIALTAWGES